jgi:hypothetical protein
MRAKLINEGGQLDHMNQLAATSMQQLCYIMHRTFVTFRFIDLNQFKYLTQHIP